MALAPFSTSILDDFFSPFGLMAGFRPGSSQLAPVEQRTGTQPILRGIPLDIIETDKEFEIKADLPGLDKNNVKLRVEKDEEQDKEEEVEGVKVHRLERTKQFAVRAVRLPESTDTENIQGKYKNGVLTLKIPKSEQKARKKEITLEQASPERVRPRPLQLCIFDDRRGQEEGHEADKVLAFFPPDTRPNDQAAAVGLVQAMLAFSSIFSADVPCEAMHAEHSRWVLRQGEPHIWLLLVAERAWHSSPCGEEALRTLLAQLHSLLVLLLGPLQRLLNQDQSGAAVRAALRGPVATWCERLASGRGPDFAPLHSPLSAREVAPTLELPRPLLASMQALLSALLVLPSPSAIPGPSPVAGALLYHEHWLLRSTLPLEDTAAVHRLAAAALLPAVRAAVQPTIGARLGVTLWGRGGGRQGRSLLDRRAWQLLPSGFLVLAPREEAAAAPDDNADAEVPLVWLQGSEEHHRLLGLRAGDCLLVLLLSAESALGAAPPGTAAVGAQLCGALAQAARAPLRRLAAGAAEAAAAAARGHVQGFRYAYSDASLGTGRASPATKVATLSRDSLALAHAVRCQLDAAAAAAMAAAALKPRRAAPGGAAGDSSAGTLGRGADEPEVAEAVDVEVVARGAHDCWVAGRAAGARRLLVALEGRGEDSLLEAAGLAAGFVDANFDGLLE
ncbi:hypothetical protein WJX81_004639 [Elliptochloris bilobata]|uniref:SHSP domain-containing protein n=1 Tax=Elliptochloris bilobata TaxID=381761 RepID=A0AAW1R423_9CHLO